MVWDSAEITRNRFVGEQKEISAWSPGDRE